MIMSMRVDYCMCMHMPIMIMPICVLMFVLVTSDQCVCYYHRRSGCHDSKSNQIDPCQLLMQEYERKERPDKRSNGIICACLGSSDDILGSHIKEYAQSIRRESEKDRDRGVSEARQWLLSDKGYDHRSEP